MDFGVNDGENLPKVANLREVRRKQAKTGLSTPVESLKNKIEQRIRKRHS
jgi:hypothetical protein